jgi:hypothetical protein
MGDIDKDGELEKQICLARALSRRKISQEY